VRATRRTLVSLTAVGAGLAGAGAAQADTYYGGGVVPDRLPKATPAAHLGSFAVGLRRADSGRRIGVRVSFAVRACGRHVADSTDALATADLAADGTFHLRGTPVRTQELGTVRLTLDGALTAGRADGTVSAKTAWGCGLTARAWSARQVDPAAPAAGAGPAPADDLLYGITTQGLKGGAVPHPLVVKVHEGGTVAHGYLSWAQQCRGRRANGRAYRGPLGWQTLLREAPITGGTWGRSDTTHETASGRRRGVRVTDVFRLTSAFDGAVLRGSFSEKRTYREGRATETCTSGGAQGFVAVPA
jgi:hypothetical protein